MPSLPKPPSYLLQPPISNCSPKASTSKINDAQTISDTILSHTLDETIHTSSKEGILSENVSHDPSVSEFKNFMVKSMAILLRRTQTIENGLQIFESQQKQAEDKNNNEEEVAIPICTEEQLLEFETQLQNAVFFKKMSSSLKLVGGDKISSATNGVFSRLIADALATKYSWQGEKRKKNLYCTTDI